ncbi:MAG TPA: TAT-variant-translocated molybdopterin oxidoreductase, partial [Pirellulales bacterium]|nr:TAT-variant-translocated molybdopterin oxidoreductase [Pirellulales bacterium]
MNESTSDNLSATPWGGLPRPSPVREHSGKDANNDGLEARPTKVIDWRAIRSRLAAASGREYWRSFEQIADTAEFQDYLKHEFPRQAGEWMDAVGRRHFLKLMAASLGLAGSMGCLRQPEEKIVPYVRQP